jgi:uncharacterized membrane-anchored protein
VALALSLAGASPLRPQLPNPDSVRSAFNARLHYQGGDIPLEHGLATVHNAGQRFRFLDAKDANLVLRAWGNPPADDALGMLVPAGMSPVDSGAWAILITYLKDGYVPDTDAARINYDSLLTQMQQSATKANPARVKQGYAPIRVIGWAVPPHYDVDTKKLYWARELQFGDDSAASRTLNYSIRVLGRRGVLVLNGVASMANLDTVAARMPDALAMVNFDPGNRYADYVPGKDKVAAYGIGALILGGVVAAKFGLLKWLIALLLAAKKAIIVGVAAVVAWFRRRFAGRKTVNNAVPPSSPPPPTPPAGPQ